MKKIKLLALIITIFTILTGCGDKEITKPVECTDLWNFFRNHAGFELQ